MYNISIISGSNRIGRFTPLVAEFLRKRFLENNNIKDSKILDLAEYNFPIMEERIGLNPSPPDKLNEFSNILKNSDAIVFVSPEYNGSFSGVLKNTLDYFKKEFKRKPIGVVTLSAGPFGGINAYHDLQKLVLALGAYPIPSKLLVSNVEETLKEENNKRLLRSSESFIKELLFLTKAISALKE